MATYKLIQDIEAEDHIVGPLTLRQFIFGMVAVGLYYLSVIVFTKGAGFLLILFLPPALFCTFFAIPFGGDQSTEVWALAKIRFFLKPRTRVWDQSGLKELVTITVPKKIERILTDGLSQGEVKSRLGALANTLDSRGWAVKNVNASVFSYHDPFASQQSDRLVDVTTVPRDVPNDDIVASDDILDADQSPLAGKFTEMIDKSTRDHRKQIINKMNDIALTERLKPQPAPQQPADYWFMNQPAASEMPADQAMFANSPAVQPGAGNANTVTAQQETAEEIAFAANLKARNSAPQIANNHMRTLQPLGAAPAQPVQQIPATPVIPATDPAIIQALAGNNDLDIATLARQAKKESDEDPNEVVISLH